MNLFAALVLSSHKQATSFISHPTVFLRIREAYRLKVTLLAETPEQSERYRFEVFAVTYPDAASGKGWGDPRIAKEAHFSKEFTEEELLSFFEKHGWSFEDGWQPVEDEG